VRLVTVDLELHAVTQRLQRLCDRTDARGVVVGRTSVDVVAVTQGNDGLKIQETGEIEKL
jgi:hypothetical protein